MHVIIIDLLESKHTEAHGLQCSTEPFWWLLTYTILTPITGYRFLLFERGEFLCPRDEFNLKICTTLLCNYYLFWHKKGGFQNCASKLSVPSAELSVFSWLRSCCLHVLKGPPSKPWTNTTSAWMDSLEKLMYVMVYACNNYRSTWI
jgi:hypothetical protein